MLPGSTHIGVEYIPTVCVCPHLKLLTGKTGPCLGLMIGGIGWAVMVDMTEFSKKDTPAQARERLQWQLDVIRENQTMAGDILLSVVGNEEDAEQYAVARWALQAMHKGDRDAILQPGGILTDEQIKLLSTL